MPIPSQNEFLYPFLSVLNGSPATTRGQLLFKLARHFAISEAEAQEKSGRQFTLVSRIAWCDVYFVKAGFVSKKQDAHDSTNDAFQITALGVRELERSGKTLSVGYLQSFYRGKIYRGAGSDDTTSDAELDLYAAFEKLPDSFTVFHSVKWFGKTRGTVGEVDFIIAHPKYGVLVLEVKGGEVSIERQGNNNVWFSRNFYGKMSPINDPCEQAERNRRALWDWLADDQRTRSLRYAIFPAVALPDSRVDRDIRPDCTQDIFIDIRHLDYLEARLIEIFTYWKSRADAKNQIMAGQPAIDTLIELLVPTRQLQPRVADIFERERRKISKTPSGSHCRNSCEMPAEGVFYVFFDNNQRLYKQISNVPMETEPFYLDENCRNTRHIHEQMIRYARDMEETLCEGPEGRPVEIIPAKNAAVRAELGKALHRLVNEQGIHPSDIVILTPAADKRSQWKENDQVGNFLLTWDMNTTIWNAVRVCTIYRFKGLESAVVILTELDKRYEDFGNQLVYVGLSRARHHAVVIGELPAPIAPTP